MALRDEFIDQLDITGNVDLLFRDNNADYIKWLENSLLELRRDLDKATVEPPK